MSIKIYTSLERLQELNADWNRLARLSRYPELFLDFEWVTWLWNRHVNRGELRVVVLRDDGRVRAIAPLVLKVRKRRWFRVRTLSLMSNWPLHYCDILCEDPDHDLPRLVDGVVALDGYDVLWLQILLSASADRLAQLLSERAHEVRVRPAHGYSRSIDLTVPYSEFATSRSSNFRRRIRVQTDRLQRTNWRFLRHQAGVGESADELLDALARLYPATWQAQNSHIETWQGQPTLLDALTSAGHRLAGIGALDISVLEVDGHPVSYLFGHFFAGRTEIYMLGYDQEYRSLGPGILLLVEHWKRAAQWRNTALDLKGFTGEDEPYKSDLGGVDFPGLLVEGFSQSVKGRGLAWFARQRRRSGVG